ncbi:MAG: hypothetical protein ICV60_19920 [Pyrinomonadaceae bacterium]|nr:hypothetical protein [Pyrinomonadaceae bacterium]
MRNCFLSAAVMLIIALCAPSGFGQKVEPGDWKVGAVTPAEYDGRIEDAAVSYAEYAPIARVTFYDIAYPSDLESYAEMDGNAILLLTAFSQSADELPLKRVYFVYEGREIELKPIKVWPKQAVTNRAVVKTFGSNRMDALYLMPIYLRVNHAPLLADFAKNKNGFSVADFATGVTPRIARLPNKPPTGAGPAYDDLIQFIRREYPGLLK